MVLQGNQALKDLLETEALQDRLDKQGNLDNQVLLGLLVIEGLQDRQVIKDLPVHLEI